MKRAILAMILTAVGILFATFVAGFVTAALAHPPAGVTLDPAIHAWFESLQQPGSGISCCGNADGHVMDPKDVRTVGNQYQVRIDGQWVPVPANVILNRVDNPTGGYVVFWQSFDPSRILCFVRPALV